MKSSLQYSSTRKRPFLDTRHRFRSLALKLWIWELSSLCLSISCITAIVVIIQRYDGQQPPAWKYQLTLNGVISFLATVAKTSMILPIAEAISQLKWQWFWKQERPVMDFQLMDAASRGPWGCLMFLCRPKGFNVAFIGAFLTIAALLMEPFIQLIPAYPLRKVESGKSWIARSLYYEDTDSAVTAGDVPVLGESTIRAYLGGLYGLSSNESALTVPTCPTGNCTWPHFTSLGQCGSCTNLTSEIYNSGLVKFWYTGAPERGFKWSFFNLTEEVYIDGYLGRAWEASSSFAYAHVAEQAIIDLYYYIRPNATSRYPHIFECVLILCVKTYSATMTNGVFREEVIDSSPRVIPHYATRPVSHMHGVPLADLSLNWTLQVNNTPHRVSLQTKALMSKWWSDAINGAQLDNFHYDLKLTREKQSDVATFFVQASQTSGLEQVFDNVTQSVTATMRNAGGPNSAIQGTVQSMEARVEARWYWAIVPITMVASTSIFLLLTIVMTVRNDTPVWKSSSLAVLAHGLDEETSACVTDDRLDVIEENVDGYRMMMVAEKVTKRRLKGTLW